LATASLLALAALGIGLNSGFADRLPPGAADMRSLAIMWDWPCPAKVALDGQRYCSFGADWTKAPHAVLWGDSHAEHLMPLLDDIGRKAGVSFVLVGPCAPFAGGTVQIRLEDDANYWKTCTRQRDRITALLQSHTDIGLVVLSASWASRRNAAYAASSGPLSGGDTLALVRTGLMEVLQPLLPSREIVIIADTPSAPAAGTGATCALASKALWRAPCSTYRQRSLNDFRKQAGDLDELFRQIAAMNPGTRLVLPGERMCASGTCVSEIDGTYIYRDGGHFRRNLDASTREKLETLMGIDAIFSESQASARAAAQQDNQPTALP
jgi:hypothetical protein